MRTTTNSWGIGVILALSLLLIPHSLTSAQSPSWPIPKNTPPKKRSNPASVNNRVLCHAEPLATPTQLGGRGLTGHGIHIILLDGTPDAHPDFRDRIRVKEEKAKTTRDRRHGTHVLGILAGSGYLNPQAKGLAPGAKVWTYNAGLTPNGLFPYEKIREAKERYGVSLSNNSYAYSFGIGCADYHKVQYLQLDAGMDSLAFADPTITSVQTIGEERNAPACQKHYAKGYRSAAARAKNSIIVGAVTPEGIATESTAWGPTDDGRLVPTIVTNGEDILSTAPEQRYAYMSGSSMACPAITGILALASERWKQLYPNQPLRNDLLKALMANTADDLPPHGADYQSGYGQANALRMVQAIEQGYFHTDSVRKNGEIQTLQIPIPEHVKTLRVMLVWNDPPGIAPKPWGIPALVNDLDLSVYAGRATHLPCAPTPEAPWEEAFPHEDHINNAEQVLLSAPSPGIASIHVAPYALKSPLQPYSICWWYDYEEAPKIAYPTPGLTYNTRRGIPYMLEACPLPVELLYSNSHGEEISLGYRYTPTGTISIPTENIIRTRLIGILPNGSRIRSPQFTVSPGISDLSLEEGEESLRFKWSELSINNASGYTLWRTSPLLPAWDSISSTPDTQIEIPKSYRYGGTSIFCLTPYNAKGQHGARSNTILTLQAHRFQTMRLLYTEESREGRMTIRDNRKGIQPGERVKRGRKIEIKAFAKRGYSPKRILANGIPLYAVKNSGGLMAKYTLPAEGVLPSCQILCEYPERPITERIPLSLQITPNTANATILIDGKRVLDSAVLFSGERAEIRIHPRPDCRYTSATHNGCPIKAQYHRGEYRFKIEAPPRGNTEPIELRIKLERLPPLHLLIGDCSGEGAIKVESETGPLGNGDAVRRGERITITVEGDNTHSPEKILINGRKICAGQGERLLQHNYRIPKQITETSLYVSASFSSIPEFGQDTGCSPQGIHIFPNPFHDYLQVSHPAGIQAISLLSPSGKIISRQLYKTGKDLIICQSLGNIPVGTYILKLQAGDNRIYSKILTKL